MPSLDSLHKKAGTLEKACKPNFVSARRRTAIIHLGRLLPNGSSDLPGNCGRPMPDTGRAARYNAFPYLVLHREEFAWPQHVTTCAGELLPHRFTHHLIQAGLFSVALVVTRSLRCPDVIRLAALWCSDFPLSRKKATAQPSPLFRRSKYSKKLLNKEVYGYPNSIETATKFNGQAFLPQVQGKDVSSVYRSA